MGKQIADSFAKVSFEDRIAQMVMAICYTTRHIDVAVFEPRSVAQLTEKQAAQELSEKQRESLLGATQAKLDKTDLKKVESQVKEWKTGEETFKKTGEKVGFEHGWEKSKAFTKQEFEQQGTHLIFRTAREEAPKGKQFVDLDVSEIDLDTAAVIIHNKTLYVAFNFKVRTQDKVTLKYKAQYSDFGKIAWSGTIDRVQAALGKELSEGNGEPNIENVVYIRTKQDLKDEKANAAPHAEMQLVTHLRTLAIDVKGLRLGCSKACCAKCAEQLRTFGVLYSTEHDNSVTHWKLPITEIETEAERTYPKLKWYTT